MNVSSIAGVVGMGSSIAYAASKGALNTMTLSLARAFAPEIRVNAICPGLCGNAVVQRTVWGRKRQAHRRAAKSDANPLKRVAYAEDIANSVLFFARTESNNVSGEFLLVDSGLHLNMTGTKRLVGLRPKEAAVCPKFRCNSMLQCNNGTAILRLFIRFFYAGTCAITLSLYALY